MAFLELNNIRKSYYLGKEEFPVLKGIDLEFGLGDFVSILGESGGGKSTLMNIIGGLDRHFQGDVTIGGQKLDHTKEKQLDAYRRATVGYIYQSYNLISHLTVLENVLVSLEMTTLSRSERVQRATELLEKVGLGEQIKKHPNQLSGGQKQRVAIARALASDPQIIIADEPTGALDSQNTKEVLAILDQIAQEGKLVIAVTHSQEVADSGTRIVRLADGRIESDERLKPAYGLPQSSERIADRPLAASSSYRTAFKHLTYNWRQNSIIVLGTAIGIFAVLLFSGLGNGVKSYINDQVNSLVNPTSVTVMRNVVEDDKASNEERLTAAYQAMGTDYESVALDDTTLAAIEDVAHVDRVEPGYVFRNTQMVVDDVKATVPELQTWTGTYTDDTIKAGTKPGEGEIVVDKTTMAEKYSDNWRDIIGQTVKVSFVAMGESGAPTPVTMDLEVSGVTDGGQAGAIVAISYNTYRDALSAAQANTAPTFASVEIDDVANVEETGKAIDAIQINGERGLVALTVGSILDTVNTITTLAANVLAAIAGISLLVSALMIIATMYMSVAERTKEIGILRALGESKKDIRRLFTSEAILIGLVSATLALVLAYTLGQGLLNSVLYDIAQFNMVQITTGNIIFAFVIALIIAFLAALLPSRKAAKLNPIDALSAD
jgi:ABC-type lipoprotein export system ATPase subunit/ABC-type antimicrobial peptide transport system permease subunit